MPHHRGRQPVTQVAWAVTVSSMQQIMEGTSNTKAGRAGKKAELEIKQGIQSREKKAEQ